MVLFTISACEIIDYDYDSYTIKNETEYTVEILAYDKYHTYSIELINDIIIEPYDKYYVEKETGEVASPMGVFTEESVDSVIITFNNSKRLIYVCNEVYVNACNEAGSILDWQLYEFEKVENRGIDYTYTLTQEDYDNAELIE